MKLHALILAASIAASAAVADDTTQFGGDFYSAGETITITQDTNAAFAAGNSVSVDASIAGSAHFMGRNITVNGQVGGSLYSAGQNISVNAPIGGDASLMGQYITVSEPVAGNLRAAGQSITVSAPIEGSAAIAGEEITISALIAGDLALNVDSVTWGDGAQVLGNLTLYGNDMGEVPASVASPDQIMMKEAHAWKGDHPAMRGDHRSGGFVGDLIGGIIFSTVAAFLIGWLAPNWVANAREHAFTRPFKTGLAGFLGISATCLKRR